MSNEDIKMLVAASDHLRKRSRRAIEDLTVTGELLRTMIEASNHMIEKTGRDLASSRQPERNRVINQTILGPQYFTPHEHKLSVPQGTKALPISRFQISD